MSIVTRQVRAPIRADAQAASQPACPPPITRTSYFKVMLLFLMQKYGFIATSARNER
jgi:hypothetical protein